MIKFTPEALRTVTDSQRWSIINLIERYKAQGALILAGGFDLPNGYISFELTDRYDKRIINGGIDPEGIVST